MVGLNTAEDIDQEAPLARFPIDGVASALSVFHWPLAQARGNIPTQSARVWRKILNRRTIPSSPENRRYAADEQWPFGCMNDLPIA